MKLTKFTVKTEPVPQPRPRACRRGQHAGVYEAPKSHKIHRFKEEVRLAARLAHQGEPFAGPVKILLEFVFARPKYLNKQGVHEGQILHTAHGDFDNLAKGVCDALKGVVWVDDRQICDATVYKVYGAKHDTQQVKVWAWEMDSNEA